MANRARTVGRREIGLLGWALRGAAAGAAGTTALNAVTYLDMALRGRPTSSTPEDTVEKLAGNVHVPIPGDAETRDNRLQGLGALTGLAAGVGMGVLAGVVRAAGFRARLSVGTGLTTAGVLVAANGPMTVLGITDPRDWSAADWLSDLVPHLAYGAVVTRPHSTRSTRPDDGYRAVPCGDAVRKAAVPTPELPIGAHCSPTETILSASRARPPRRAPEPRGRRAPG